MVQIIIYYAIAVVFTLFGYIFNALLSSNTRKDNYNWGYLEGHERGFRKGYKKGEKKGYSKAYREFSRRVECGDSAHWLGDEK